MMFGTIAILGMLTASPSHPPATEWKPTNDAAVEYQWSVQPAWRPLCELRVKDAREDPKHVSIHYRNRSGSRIAMTVRMNPGDPQNRTITGCVAVDTIEVARR